MAVVYGEEMATRASKTMAIGSNTMRTIANKVGQGGKSSGEVCWRVSSVTPDNNGSHVHVHPYIQLVLVLML